MTRRLAVAFVVLFVGGTVAGPAAAAQPELVLSDYVDIGNAWLAGEELPLDTAVQSQDLSSFGNDPAIPPGEIKLQEVLLTSTPLSDGAPPDLETFLRELGAPTCGQQVGDAVTLCGQPWSLDELGDDGRFLMVGGRFDGPLPLSGPRDFLYEFGVEIMDPTVGPPWQADPQFPNDYLQGLNSCFPYQYSGGQWNYNGYLQYSDPETFPEPVPRSVVTVVNETGFLTLLPQPPAATSMRIYGFKTSLAQPYRPDTVVASIYPSIADGPISLTDFPSVLDVIEEEERTTTTTEADDAADAAPEDGDDADDVDGGGGSSALPIVAIGLGLVALGAGAWFKWRPRPPDAGSAAPAPPAAAPPPPAAAPPPASAPEHIPTSAADRGDDWMDAFIGAFGGTGTTARPDDASDAAWDDVRRREDHVQDQIHAEYEQLTTDLAAAMAAFDAAVDRYQTTYARVASASTRLQGLLAAWAESKTIAQRADIAFSIATLLWTGGLAGVKAVRWVRTARAGSGAAAAGTAGDALQAGDTVVGTAWADAPTVVDRAVRAGETSATVVTGAGRAVNGVDRAVPLYAEAIEAGIDVDGIIAKHAGWAKLDAATMFDDVPRDWDQIQRITSAIAQADIEIMRALAAIKGWQKMQAATANFLSDLLSTGRLAVAGRGPGISADALTILREMATDAKFWDSLKDAAGEFMYGDELIDEVALLFTADDIHFLKLMVETGGDVAELRKALGPTRVTAIEATTAAATTVRTGGAAGTPAYGALPGTVATGTAADQVLGAGGALGEAGGLEGALDQLGTAGGGSGGFGSAVSNTLWGFLTGPIELTVDWFYTWEGLEALDELLQGHGDDLIDMGDALNDAIDALKGAGRALSAAGVGNPSRLLGGKSLDDLNGVLDDYRDVIDGAGDDWRDAHDDEIAETFHHIAQKMEDLQASMAAFAHMQDRLPVIIEWLESLRTYATTAPQTGQRVNRQRSALAMFNPEAFVRLSAIRTLLGAVGATGFLLDSTGPVSNPIPSGRPPDETPEQASRIQQEAMRRQAAEMDELNRQADEAAARGEAPDLPDFSDLPPPDGD